MHNSVIKTNECFRELIAEIDTPIRDYAELKRRIPESQKICPTEETAQLQFAITRLFLSAAAGYGKELAHFIYTLDEGDIITLDRYLHVHAGIMQITNQLDWSHIPIEFIYRFYTEVKAGLNEYDNILLALISYGCGIEGDEPTQLTHEQHRRLYAYTGYRVEPKYIIPPTAKLKRELILQIKEPTHISTEPGFHKYRDFLVSQDSEIVRRYLFLSEESAVLTLSELPKEKLQMYFRAFMHKYPYGLPTATHVEYAMGDFDYLLSNLQLAKPFIHSDDSISQLEQGMIQVFFGACFSDVLSWLGGDDKMADALKDIIICKQDAMKNREAVKLHAMLKSAETPVRMQYICKLYTNRKAYLECLKCFTQATVLGSDVEYIKELTQVIKMPRELTPDAVRHHFIDFIYNRNAKAYEDILGMARHDAINLFTPEIPANIAGINLLMGTPNQELKGYSKGLIRRLQDGLQPLRSLSPKQKLANLQCGFSELAKL